MGSEPRTTKLTPAQAARINEFGRSIVEAFRIAEEVQRTRPEIIRVSETEEFLRERKPTPSTRLTPDQAARINEWGRGITDAFRIAEVIRVSLEPR
jgi:hypothetical protein